MTGAIQTFTVSDAMLQRVLDPYLPSVRFLKRAELHVIPHRDPERPHLRLIGDFEFPGPWYIRNTGHFNAVDFNLSFNMLVYALVAQSGASGAVPYLAHMDPKNFEAAQLPNMLITKLQCRFPRPMLNRSVQGEVFLGNVIIKKGRSSWVEGRKLIFGEVRARFTDQAGGCAEGSVNCVLVDGPSIQFAPTEVQQTVTMAQ